jgi:alanyl-tRNA synthetase
MDVDSTVTRFRDFYRDRGHSPVPDAPLPAPPDDPVLFTTSGMHPLTPYLRGRPHPGGNRLVGLQTCLRTTDLDEVGDTTHLTVFQMLGTWSLGDYDVPASVRWCVQLLGDGFGVDRSRLHATVFAGNDEVPRDTVTEGVWAELGVPVEGTVEDNWWSHGSAGLCGPDSELFVWTGDGPPSGRPTTDGRWAEIWNHVGMRYTRDGDGRLHELPRPCVDTGLGLERLLLLLQGRRSVFETDVLAPWSEAVRRLWSPGSPTDRVVADHLRSALVVLGAGVRPAARRHGYVLRRLLRRVLTLLWQEDPARTLGDLPASVVDDTVRRFDLPPDRQQLRDALLAEERGFRDLVVRGRPVVERRLRRGPLTDVDYRLLADTHGLPRELVEALLVR